jgi:hypothetical protein
MEQQPKQPVQREQKAEPSSFEFLKSLNLSDSIFDSPNGKELSDLLNKLAGFSNKEVKPVRTPALFRTSENPKKTHLDPDEERALENNQVENPSCKRKKALQVYPRSPKVLKRSNSFVTFAV